MPNPQKMSSGRLVPAALLTLAACLAASLPAGSAVAQTTRIWAGTDGDMATAANWSPAGVPSAADGDTMEFDGTSGVSTIFFPGGTFSGNDGLGGLLVTAAQTAPLAITNSGTADSIFRLRADAAFTIEAGAGAFSMGAGGNGFFLNLANSGDGNRFTNNSASVATLGPQARLSASGGTGGLAIFDGTGDWLVSGATTSGLSRGLVKEGSGTLTLSAANEYTGPTTTVNGGTLVLAGGNNRLSTTTWLTFTGTSGTLAVGSNSQSIAALTVPNGLAASYAVTGAGGTLAIGSGSTGLEIGPGGTVAQSNAVTLDLSGLGNFTYTNPGSGTVFRVGLKLGSGGANYLNQVATATLAASNTITASLIGVGDTSAGRSGGSSTLRLGEANSLNAATINVGSSGRSNATLEFAPGLTNPAVTIRGLDGSSALPEWLVGMVANFNETGGNTWNAHVNFSGGTVDALVTEMFLGNAMIGAATGRAGTQNATLTMGSGTLAVGTLTIGRIDGTGGVSNTLAANGTLTIGTAGGQVVADSILLARNTYTGGTDHARTVSGTINLTAGTLAATSIALGLQAGNATATTAFNWTGGTLTHKADTDLLVESVPIALASGTGTFHAAEARTITVDAVSSLSGGGGLAKTGPGTLLLAGTNTYAGPTTVTSGTLALGSGGGLASAAIDVAAGARFDVSALAGGFTVASGQELRGAGTILGSLLFGAESKLAFTSSLSVDSGTVLFSGFGIDDIVGLDGTLVSAGTYTLLGGDATFDLSGALNVGFDERADIGGGKEAYFNQGSLQVIVVPEPGLLAAAGIAIGSLGLIRRRLRRG